MPKTLVTALASLLTLVVLAAGVGAFLLSQSPSGSAERSASEEQRSGFGDTSEESEDIELDEIDIPDMFDEAAPPEANRALLLAVLKEAGAGSGTTPTADVLDALGDKGFPLGDTSYSNPATQIEFPADSISVAIALGDICLIGQYSTKWVEASTQPALDDGQCLLGEVLSAEQTTD